jgi:hypothetical protein
MTHNELETLSLLDTTSPDDKDEEYKNPLDISDIISICQEYNKLGWQIQLQVENILEIGVEESIRCGNVRKDALPFVKNFLRRICDNVYFGDATMQAQDCIALIQAYEDKYKIKYYSKCN